MPWDHVDPDSVVPALPMPFRMIDHLIRGLVEEALDLARDVVRSAPHRQSDALLHRLVCSMR